MRTPLHRSYHQQSRHAKSFNEVLGADASKVQVGVAGQSSSIGNRLAENVRYLLVRKLLMWLSE
jgi:hypothetical protein